MHTEEADPKNIPEKLEHLADIIVDKNNLTDEQAERHLTYEKVPHRRYGAQHSEHWILRFRTTGDLRSQLRSNRNEILTVPRPSAARVEIDKQHPQHGNNITYAVYDT